MFSNSVDAFFTLTQSQDTGFPTGTYVNSIYSVTYHTSAEQNQLSSLCSFILILTSVPKLHKQSVRCSMSLTSHYVSYKCHVNSH